MTDYLKFAISLSYKAGAIAKKNFTLGMVKEWKEDDTPVTATDKKINRLVIDTIQKRYPKHSIVAEEESRVLESEYTWVCDPVDGTAAFSHGYPLFTFSIALTKNGESILGVIYDPIGKRLAYAEKGRGAFLNGKKISVSTDKELSKTSFVNLDYYHRLGGLYESLTKTNCYISSFCSGLYAGLLVAVGEFTGEIFEYPNPWDAAALKIIVEEAGGKVTDLLGKEQRYDQKTNGFIVSNGAVHQQLVDIVTSILNKPGESAGNQQKT